MKWFYLITFLFYFRSVTANVNQINHLHGKVDVWIVGSGELGTILAKEWKELYPKSKIITETRTSNRHSILKLLGTIPIKRSERNLYPNSCAKNVIVCIPPSHQFDDKDSYFEEIKNSFDLYDNSDSNENNNNDNNNNNNKGMFLLISSTAVYGNTNGTVNEFSPVERRQEINPRAARSVEAEDIVLNSNLKKKSVLRLSGLYTSNRGPHSFWLRSKQSLPPDDGNVINLISYEDAAKAAIKVLQNGKNNGIYLATDDKPLTRTEILNVFEPSTSTTSNVCLERKGKICNSSWSRKELNWQPKYKSFIEYFSSSKSQ